MNIISLSIILIIVTYYYTRYILLSENETINSLAFPSLILLGALASINIHNPPPSDFSLFCLGILILVPLMVTHIYEKNTTSK